MKNQHSVISNFKDELSSFWHDWHSHHSCFQSLEKGTKINKNRERRNCWFCDWRNGTRMPVFTCSICEAAPCVEAGGHFCARSSAVWWRCTCSGCSSKCRSPKKRGPTWPSCESCSWGCPRCGNTWALRRCQTSWQPGKSSQYPAWPGLSFVVWGFLECW